jgi:uncharacterized protein DUF4412
MKKTQALTAILFITLFYCNLLHTQSLQNILNSIKQTAQERANEKSLHKSDNTTQINPNSASLSSFSGDTTPISKVLNAFAKAAKENPNDTSSADLTMKALGNLMGGGGVSKADSMTAIKSFTSAKGGSGVVYQYVTIITSKQRGTHADTSSKYFTSSGEGRSEMDLPGMMGIQGGNKLTILAHANQPRYSLILDASNKTYSLNVIDTSLINSGGASDYQVTKIGSETVQGYNCVHAKIISTVGSGMFKSTSTMDIWTSTDVPGYAILKKTMTMQNVTPKMMQVLEQAGCGGFFVKMSSQSKDISMNMMLIKTQQQNFPASIFCIPAGYTESKQNMMSHMMQGAKK